MITLGNKSISLPEMWRKKVTESGCTELSFGIRPEHIKLSKNSIENAFKGSVKYIEDYGNRYGIYFEIEGNEIIGMADENDLKADDLVYFSPNLTKIHLFDKNTTISIGYPEEL